MPGLLRGVARTAVIAGTATAVSGRVGRRQAEKYADRDAQIYADEQTAYNQKMAAQAPPAAAAPAQDDVVSQLKEFAQLHEQGILTDDEFAAQKAKLLGS